MKERERTNQEGEEISADVVGPISPVSLGGARYFLTVVDTASRYAWVRILKAKSQAEEELKTVINQIENRKERKVKRVITDGGGEFVNETMKQWLGEKGIAHLVTTRNTPQNNGTAEWMNRTIMEKARTLRIDANLPKQLWAELISTAVFMYNWNQNTNPFMKMWGVEPKLTFVKPVGSQVFYSIHHFQGIGKLDPRCRKGILIGFDEYMSSYRIWDPETGKVVRSRDVTFSNQNNDMGEVLTDETTGDEPQTGTTEASVTEDNTTVQPTMNEGGDNMEEIIHSQQRNQEQPKTQTSNRETKTIERYGNWSTYVAARHELEESNKDDVHAEAMAFQTFIRENAVVPDSFKTAKDSTEWPAWRKAIFAEIDSIIENGVFEIVPEEKRDKNKTLINTRWVLNKKFDTSGNLKRYKARCVARGFKQKEGIDYEETFSPTGRLSTMRYIIYHATQRKIKPRQAGFVTAYLNSKLEDEEAVYISLPEGFVEWLKETKQETYTKEIVQSLIEEPEGYVIKLKKTLYGLKQAARGWYTTMTNWFIKHGYRISDADPCLLISDKGDLAFAWVDDLILVGENTDELISKLQKDFKIKDLGVAQHILGMKIEYLTDNRMFKTKNIM